MSKFNHRIDLRFDDLTEQLLVALSDRQQKKKAEIFRAALQYYAAAQLDPQEFERILIDLKSNEMFGGH